MERVHPLRLAAAEPVPPEVAERLAALGYAAATRNDAAAGPRLDPRDGLPAMRELEAASRLVAQGQLTAAEAALRALLVRSPGLVEARVRLGEVLMETGRPDEAADVFTVAAASPGTSGDVWVSLGEARLRQGRLEEARAAARAGTADSPVRAHELLARIALRAGDLAEAEREAQAAAGGRARPRPSTLVLSAEVRIHAGDLQGALARLDEAQALARSLRLDAVPGLEFQRADALARLGRMAEAEAAYGREVRLYPRHLQAWANLAVLLHLQGRASERDRVLESMSEANPGPAAARVAATTLDALGDRAKAAVWRRRESAP
jgi:Flp pilus assembly protein TadD